MKKRVFGRKLKRTTNQRKALFKSLTQALVLHGRIKTTEAKAKSIRGEVEKLITRAMRNDSNTLAYLKQHVHVPTAERLVEIATAFKGRPGGYTRIIRLGGRKKDNASMVLIEFVEKIPSAAPVAVDKTTEKETKAVESSVQVEEPKEKVKKAPAKKEKEVTKEKKAKKETK